MLNSIVNADPGYALHSAMCFVGCHLASPREMTVRNLLAKGTQGKKIAVPILQQHGLVLTCFYSLLLYIHCL